MKVNYVNLVQRTLFDIIKIYKSPKSECYEIEMVMDLIQGLCLVFDANKDPL